MMKIKSIDYKIELIQENSRGHAAAGVDPLRAT